MERFIPFREGDFRASGSGHMLYEKYHFNEETIRLSLEVAEKLKSQCLSLDYVYKENKPLIVEMSLKTSLKVVPDIGTGILIGMKVPLMRYG